MNCARCGEPESHPMHRLDWEGKCSGCGRSGYRYHIHHVYEPEVRP